jgi:hypothetical protein
LGSISEYFNPFLIVKWISFTRFKKFWMGFPWRSPGGDISILGVFPHRKPPLTSSAAKANGDILREIRGTPLLICP